MRMALFLFVCALGLVGCEKPQSDSLSASNTEFQTYEGNDDRYDLLTHNMPSITVNNAKTCAAVMRKTSLFKFAITGPEKEGFEQGLKVWNEINNRYLKQIDGIDGVLVKGNVQDLNTVQVEPLFNDNDDLEVKAKACGEYAGGLFVQVGGTTLRKTISLAEAVQPGIFESLGHDFDQLEAGFIVMERRARELQDMPAEEKISCVAIFQAMKHADPTLKPRSNIFMTALVQDIESGALDPSKISEKSEYWRRLKSDGPTSLVEIEAYDDVASECEAGLETAIKKHAEASN